MFLNYKIIYPIYINYHCYSEFKPKQEIDYIEIVKGNMSAYEFTWNPKTRKKIPKTFTGGYPDCSSKIINFDNFDEFLIITL